MRKIVEATYVTKGSPRIDRRCRACGRSLVRRFVVVHSMEMLYDPETRTWTSDPWMSHYCKRCAMTSARPEIRKAVEE